MSDIISYITETNSYCTVKNYTQYVESETVKPIYRILLISIGYKCYKIADQNGIYVFRIKNCPAKRHAGTKGERKYRSTRS
jgi:hypothetical protein